MKKFLSINANEQTIRYWQDKGYQVVFVFTPEVISGVVRPDYSSIKVAQAARNLK